MQKEPGTTKVLRVAVPSPLLRTFDYLPPRGRDLETLMPGVRLRVPFGRTQLVGVVVEVAAESRIDSGRLKKIGRAHV